MIQMNDISCLFFRDGERGETIFRPHRRRGFWTVPRTNHSYVKHREGIRGMGLYVQYVQYVCTTYLTPRHQCRLVDRYWQAYLSIDTSIY